MPALRNADQTTEVEVLVVGAGPAGAVAARWLAMRGVDVMMVDRASFPRWKICGCCLNGASLHTLTELGLSEVIGRLGAVRLDHLLLASRGHFAKVPLPDGVALSRLRFDHALIRHAIDAGVDFRARSSAAWTATSARGILVTITTPGRTTFVQARVVIAADGLAAGFTRRIPGVRCTVSPNARVGGGALVRDPAQAFPPHEIYMAVGSAGYVGMVRLEDGSLNVAAALDARAVRRHGRFSAAVHRIVRDSGLPALEAMSAARWQGTPPLTRSYRPPPSGNVFLIGDAAEYVEPFTGEGMAWALASGAAVGPYVQATLRNASSSVQAAWLQKRHALLSERMQRCRWIARGLRHPTLATLAVRLLGAYPQLAGRYLATVNRAAVRAG